MSPTITPAPIRKSFTVRASPEKAFDVFTAGFHRWWPKSHSIGDAPLKTATIEPRVGGRWFSLTEDGVEHEWGEVLAWEPPGRILLAWRLNAAFAYDPDLLTEVDVRFTPAGEGQTHVAFEHRGLERFGATDAAQAIRGGMDQGWGIILDAFQAVANAYPTPRGRSPAMSDPIIVHGIPGSPYVRKPLLVCEEKGAPYRLDPMAFGANAHKQPEYLALHPFGRLPAIEHGDFRLYEAQAIARYIDRVLDGPSLTPSDPRKAARMDQVMNIVDWYVTPSVSGGIAFNRVVKPRFGMPVDEAAVANAVPMARTCVAALEEILADNPYFAGEAVSLADLFAYCHFEFLGRTPEGAEILAGSPLLAWMARMAERPSVRNTSWERLAAAA